MAEFPDLLINPNPNAPTLDASGNQVRGINIFETTAERDALNATVRIPGALAIIKGSDELYQYTATTVDDTAWQDASNWLGIGSAGGAGVQNLNNLDGNLTLVGSGSVTITDDGSNTITIDSTGGGVTDVDGETGSITITGGDGIEVDVVTGTGEIEISATGGGTEGEDLSLIVRTNPYTVAGDHEGTVLSIGTLGLTLGTVYKWSGSQWSTSNAGAVGNSDGLMGISTATASAPDVLVSGIIQVASVPGSAGDVLYLDTSNGLLTNDVSGFTQGDIVRVMGYNLGGNRIYFDPSRDWIELG
tara:strand:+ start:2660 stop:3565 length:906 start_codon:yes stop_codon:yes gene_type:complete